MPQQTWPALVSVVPEVAARVGVRGVGALDDVEGQGGEVAGAGAGHQVPGGRHPRVDPVGGAQPGRPRDRRGVQFGLASQS